MGIILGFALFVGVIIGLAISVGLCVLAVILTKKASTRRLNVWRVFVSVALVSLPVLACAVYFVPYDTGSPGSNYNILFKYYFVIGLAYAAIPGIASVLSFLATTLCPVCAGNPDNQPAIS